MVYQIWDKLQREHPKIKDHGNTVNQHTYLGVLRWFDNHVQEG